MLVLFKLAKISNESYMKFRVISPSMTSQIFSVRPEVNLDLQKKFELNFINFFKLY
jgi:hypothetical protein